jgi:hypothetical protein
VPRARGFAIGGWIGHYSWEESAPYEDHAMGGVSIERLLWSGVRGRAAIGAGKTTLGLDDEDRDAWIMPFDLQVLLSPDFGPLRGFGVLPYGVLGFGSLVTNPSGVEGEESLPTRAQSQWTYGGGIQARLPGRLEARVEGSMAGIRFSDPVATEDRETQTIHNRRWEGRVSWLF